ncbi:WXG100 family type VII secretion target [Streptomyces sp. NBC_01455]|uniref:WXG100 family type VII secretion target n=1 Tax=Streptomyces sp. NBC_01455 TaxID=2903874 RepID=UPI002E3797E0|nr:WXG100 family type VII secretion target [Streptomyces sp. NBC_01455]
MSSDEFQVALGDLRGATGVVRQESEHISGLINQIQAHFEAAHSDWESPAGSTFKTISEWFTESSRDLESLLQDMVRRMQAAYDNYASAETANTRNSGG